MSSRLPSRLPRAVVALAGIWGCGGDGPRPVHGRESPDTPAHAAVPTATRPADACGWIPASEVEQLVGPLAGPPVPAGRDCRYPLKVSDSLRAQMRKIRDLDQQFAGRPGAGTDPDSVAVLVGVDLSGDVHAERATGMAGEILAGWLGPDSGTPETSEDTAEDSIPAARAQPPAGWDVAGSTLGWPGFQGRVGHVSVTVYAEEMVGMVPREKMAQLATRVRDRIPDLPFATDQQRPDPVIVSNAASPDPCSILTRAEAEAILGKLAVAPYRSAEESPLAYGGGRSCSYYTAGHHAFVLTPWWNYGKSAFSPVRGIGGLVRSVVPDREAEAADTLEGPWDEAAVDLDGAHFFLTDNRLLRVGYATSSTDAAGAVRLARIAVARLAAAPPQRK
jgi:hypothetical protein